MKSNNSDLSLFNFNFIINRPEKMLSILASVEYEDSNIYEDRNIHKYSQAVHKVHAAACETTDMELFQRETLKNTHSTIERIKKMEKEEQFSLFQTNYINRLINSVFKNITKDLNNYLSEEVISENNLFHIEELLKRQFIIETERTLEVKLEIFNVAQEKKEEEEKDLFNNEEEGKDNDDDSEEEGEDNDDDNEEEEKDKVGVGDIEKKVKDKVDRESDEYKRNLTPIEQLEHFKKSIRNIFEEKNIKAHQFALSKLSPTVLLSSLSVGDVVYLKSSDLNAGDYEILKNFINVEEDKRNYTLTLPAKIISSYFSPINNQLINMYNIENKWLAYTICEPDDYISVPKKEVIKSTNDFLLLQFEDGFMHEIDQNIPENFLKLRKKEENEKEEEEDIGTNSQLTTNEKITFSIIFLIVMQIIIYFYLKN